MCHAGKNARITSKPEKIQNEWGKIPGGQK